MHFKFPIILCEGREVMVVGPKFLQWWRVKVPKPDTLLCAASRSSRKPKRLRWILEANGTFRELEFVGIRREWTRPVAFLWNFMMDEFRMSPPRAISVGELEVKLGKVSDRFPEAPQGKDFKAFLRAHSPEEIISEVMLRSFLGPTKEAADKS